MGNYGMKRWFVVQLANAGILLSTGGLLWCIQLWGEASGILIFVVIFMQFYCLRIALFPSRSRLPTGLFPQDNDTDSSYGFLLVLLFFLDVLFIRMIDDGYSYRGDEKLTLQEFLLYVGGGYWILHSIFIIPFTVKSIGTTFRRGFETEGSSMPSGNQLNTAQRAKLVIAFIVTLILGYLAFDPSGDGESWLLSTCLGFLAYTIAIYKRAGKAAERLSLALGLLTAIIYTAYDQILNSSLQHSNLTLVLNTGVAGVIGYGNAFILFFLFPKILDLFGLEVRLNKFLKNLLSTQQRRLRAKQREEAKLQIAESHACNTKESKRELFDCAPPKSLTIHTQRLADVQTVFQNLPGDRDFHLVSSQVRVIDPNETSPHKEDSHLYAYYRPFLVRYYTARLHAGEEPSNLHESCREFLDELRRQYMIVNVDIEANRIRKQSEWDLKQVEVEDNEQRRREEERRKDEDDFNITVAELELRLEEIKTIKTHSTLATHEREAALVKCYQDEQRLRNRISSLRERHPEFREENTVK